MAHLGPHLRRYPVHAPGSAPHDPYQVISPSEDTFEIEDFTAASEWEKFVSALEKVLRSWKLTSGPDEVKVKSKSEVNRQTGRWRREQSQVDYLGVTFGVTRHYLETEDEGEEAKAEVTANDPEVGGRGPTPAALSDMMNPDHDFPAAAHPVHYFYGHYDFVVLAPVGREEVDNLSRINVRSNCEVIWPIFTYSLVSRFQIALSTATVAVNNAGCTVPVFVHGTKF